MLTKHSVAVCVCIALAFAASYIQLEEPVAAQRETRDLRSEKIPVQNATTGTSALFMLNGGGSGTANGDYISDSDGLNQAYRFFVEVPPDLPALSIDIFDADVGAGGSAEAGAGRDRARNSFNSSVSYSLFDPEGNQRPVRFSTGDTTQPAGADNNWLQFYGSGNGRNVI
ncbi:MAG: hypothetical protein KF685_12275, partial [Acidobacteria bacterium]|nr:hypothetical protein [Acidobacteriota bacterium]